MACRLTESLAASFPILKSNTASLPRLHPPALSVFPQVELLDLHDSNQWDTDTSTPSVVYGNCSTLEIDQSDSAPGIDDLLDPMKPLPGLNYNSEYPTAQSMKHNS